MMAEIFGQFGMTTGLGEQEFGQGQAMAIILICTNILVGQSEEVVVVVLLFIG
jgi:hypothetical protein